MKDNVRAVVEAYKALSEEDQEEFNFETFNSLSYGLGVDDGRKRVAVEQILALIDNNGPEALWRCPRRDRGRGHGGVRR